MKTYALVFFIIFFPILTFSSVSFCQEAVIVYTNNTNGFLQPCSCPGAPYGGLNRRVTVLKQIQTEIKDFFLLDAGSLFSIGNNFNRNDGIILDIYKQINYDAINIGESEITEVGVEYLQKKPQFPFISSNLVSKEDGSPFFPSYLIIEKKGVKVGVLGILTKEILKIPSISNNINILDPKEALEREIKKIREQVDFIVVLSQLNINENKKIAEEVPGIDLIIGGIDFYPKEEAIREKGTILVQCGFKGHYVGKIVLYKNEPSKSVNKLYKLDTSVANDTDVQKMIDNYENDRADNILGKLQSKSSFFGSVYCKKCHEKEYSAWETTHHAKALESLKKENKDRVIECLVCHTLGYKIEGETGVQCEHCHNIPVNHDKIKKSPVGVSRRICFNCHNPEKSPKFDYIEYLRQVIH